MSRGVISAPCVTSRALRSPPECVNTHVVETHINRPNPRSNHKLAETPRCGRVRARGCGGAFCRRRGTGTCSRGRSAPKRPPHRLRHLHAHTTKGCADRRAYGASSSTSTSSWWRSHSASASARKDAVVGATPRSSFLRATHACRSCSTLKTRAARRTRCSQGVDGLPSALVVVSAHPLFSVGELFQP